MKIAMEPIDYSLLRFARVMEARRNAAVALLDATYAALTQGIKCDLAPGGLHSMPDALQRCHNSVVECALLFPNVGELIVQLEKNCTDIYDAGRATEKAMQERIAELESHAEAVRCSRDFWADKCNAVHEALKEIEQSCGLDGFPEDAPDQVAHIAGLVRAALSPPPSYETKLNAAGDLS